MDIEHGMQPMLEYAEKFVSEESNDIIRAGRYLKKFFIGLRQSFSGSSLLKSNEHLLVRHIISQAGKKLGLQAISDTKYINSLVSVEETDFEIPEEWESRFGSVVWVKASKNDPWWPSYVCDPRYLDEDNPETLRENAFQNIGKKYLVYYYGEASKNKHGFVKSGQASMRDYFEYREEFEKQNLETKKKSLDNAIPLADLEAVLQPSDRQEWFQFLLEINSDSLKKQKPSALKKKAHVVTSEVAVKIVGGKSDLLKESNKSKRGDEIIEITENKKIGKIDSRVNGVKSNSLAGIMLNSDDIIDLEERIENGDKGNECPGTSSGGIATRDDKNDVLSLSSGDEADTEVEMIDKRDAKRIKFETSLKMKEFQNQWDDHESSIGESSVIKERMKDEKKIKKRNRSISGSDEDAEIDIEGSQAGDLEGQQKIQRRSDGDVLHQAVITTSGVNIPKKRGRPSLKPKNDDEDDFQENQVVGLKEKKKLSLKEKSNKKLVGKSKFKKNFVDTTVNLEEEEEVAEREEEVVEEEEKEEGKIFVANDEFCSGQRTKSKKLSKIVLKAASKVSIKAGKSNFKGKENEKGKHDDLEDSKPLTLRRSSRTIVYSVDDSDKEEEDEEDEKEEEEEEEEEEESEENSEADTITQDSKSLNKVSLDNTNNTKKKGRPKKLGNDVVKKVPQKVVKKVKGKRGRPPKNPLVESSSSEVPKLGRLVKKIVPGNLKGKNLKKSENEGNSGDEVPADDDVEEDDDDEEEEDEEEEEEDEKEVVELVKVQMSFDNETTSQRLTRLLRLLNSSTKDNSLLLVEKAISTIDKIDNMNVGLEELKSSGAGEQIAALRKHSNSAIASRAKQLRSKWVEEARKGMAPQVPISTTSTTSTTGTVGLAGVMETSTVIMTGPRSIISSEPINTLLMTIGKEEIAENHILESSAKLDTGEGSVELEVEVKNQILSFPPITIRNVLDTSAEEGSTGNTHPMDFNTDILPECVKNNIGRSRAVRMLYSAFNKSSPSRAYLAAIWFEGKIYKSLCAVAMEVNTQALAATNSSLSKNEFLSPKGTGTGTGTVAVGDATIATQGAGSAFNKYLANVTRLTFALQTEELKQLRDKILLIFEKNEEDGSLFDNIVNTAVLAKSISELEDLNATLKF